MYLQIDDNIINKSLNERKIEKVRERESEKREITCRTNSLVGANIKAL